MIHKKLPGTISEYDLGEIYSYLEYFNKMYAGFESEIDSILAGIVEIYKIEYCHDCNVEVLRSLRNNKGAGRKPSIDDDSKCRVIELSKQGLSIREIAERTQISKSSVQRILSATKTARPEIN